MQVLNKYTYHEMIVHGKFHILFHSITALTKYLKNNYEILLFFSFFMLFYAISQFGTKFYEFYEFMTLWEACYIDIDTHI